MLARRFGVSAMTRNGLALPFIHFPNCDVSARTSARRRSASSKLIDTEKVSARSTP